jgi:hypothetical protein
MLVVIEFVGVEPEELEKKLRFRRLIRLSVPFEPLQIVRELALTIRPR